jgi:CheY-like chemotaxis protein
VNSPENDANPSALTILLAEDDPFLREMIGAGLRAHGCLVVEAETGDHALPLLRAGGIDVLLTDISMPGSLDGWSLAEQARLIDPRIVVIYSSSAPRDAERQVSGSLYLRKPYRPSAVIAAIRRLTSRDNDPASQ